MQTGGDKDEKGTQVYICRKRVERPDDGTVSPLKRGDAPETPITRSTECHAWCFEPAAKHGPVDRGCKPKWASKLHQRIDKTV